MKYGSLIENDKELKQGMLILNCKELNLVLKACCEFKNNNKRNKNINKIINDLENVPIF